MIAALLSRVQRPSLFSMLIGVVVGFCFSSSNVLAVFSPEAASPDVLDAVCFYPQRLADADAGMAGEITRASPIRLWTMSLAGTVRSTDGDGSKPLKIAPIDLNPADLDADVTAARTSWTSYVNNRIVPLLKAKSRDRLK